MIESSSSQNLLLVVAAAICDTSNKTILLSKRPPNKPMPGKWEFPGGKVDAGEAPESAIIREIKEELGVVIEPEQLCCATFASHDYGEFHLLMPVFVCSEWIGEPEPREGQELHWFTLAEAQTLDMPPPDGPLIERLQKLLSW